MTDLTRVSLEAVIVAVTEATPRVLAVETGEGLMLPSDPLRVDQDLTLELGMRRAVGELTGLDIGYVEQLYTFGDLNRDRPRPGDEKRSLGVGYLALIREAQPSAGAAWVDCYSLFPWEDHRSGRPRILHRSIETGLRRWMGRDPVRRERAQIAFGLEGTPWDAACVLDRYELLYEAQMVGEWHVDHDQAPPPLPAGIPMAGDHRRVTATALGRLRGKLTYRPVVFELLPDLFTLSQLQELVEALAGERLHKQNFRRLVERGGLVEGTGQYTSTGGRPAELFHFRREVLLERPRPGVGR